jgi:elongation factor G
MDHPLALEPITFPEPVMQMAIEPESTRDDKTLEEALADLSSEDPTLRVVTDEETGQVLLRGMGELHLEIIADRLQREKKVRVRTGRPQVSYRESVSARAEAEGLFDREISGRMNFGHVRLAVLPGHSGVEFHVSLAGPALPDNILAAIRTGIMGSVGAGPIAGFPLDGLVIHLLGARLHETDSTELGYSSAASSALREAIGMARPVLREPVMKVDIVCPADFVGDVIGDIGSRRGRVLFMTPRGEVSAIDARVPLAELFGYTTSLRSLTQGRASYTMQFLEYAEVPAGAAQALMQKMGVAYQQVDARSSSR